MNSIRFRLFIILVAATSFVWLSAFVWVQQSTRGKVERVLDARLAEAGQMVSSLMSDQRIDLNTLAVAATGEGKADGILQTDYSHKLSCQIWSLNGALVGSSGSAPLGKLTDQDTGFSTTVIEGEKWRVYSVVNEALGMRIMVGDSYKVRDRLVEDVTKGLALPALLMLPIMVALILVSVQRGLAPLERMAGALSQRPAEDLSPVSVTPLPREIKPMGDALNGLFSRVNVMRDREKSFTSFAAHELKTPLAAIKTQAQVAAMAPDKDTRLRALDQIQHGVGRADRMVRQLLALASLDSDDALDGPQRKSRSRSDSPITAKPSCVPTLCCCRWRSETWLRTPYMRPPSVLRWIFPLPTKAADATFRSMIWAPEYPRRRFPGYRRGFTGEKALRKAAAGWGFLLWQRR